MPLKFTKKHGRVLIRLVSNDVVSNATRLWAEIQWWKCTMSLLLWINRTNAIPCVTKIIFSVIKTVAAEISDKNRLLEFL